jgi:methionine-rich copper-binding protein CopC
MRPLQANLRTGPGLERRGRAWLAPVLALGALLGMLATPPAALAHANLSQADPPPGALDALPDHLTLSFDSPLAAGSAAQLLDAGGATVPGVESQIDPNDPTRLLVAVPGVPAGAYSVAWTSVSAGDGHELHGLYALLVGGASPPAAAAPPARQGPGTAAAGLDVQLAAVPDAQGVLQWQATVVAPPGPAVQRVSLRFTPPQPDLGVSQVVADGAGGAGVYAAAQPVALAGTWQVEVIVRRAGVADDASVPFTWTAS